MAEIAAKPFVSFLVKSLGDLLIQEARFLSGVRDQVQQLQIELERMQCLLLDADAKQERNNSIRNCVAEIREVAYDAEDVIETFVLKVAFRRRTGILNVLVRYSCVVKDSISRHKVGMEIKSLETKISSIRTNLQSLGIIGTTTRTGGDRSSSSNNERPQRRRQAYPHIIAEKVIVGLDEDVKEVVKQLVVKEERQYCRVVSIWGMGGIGKTTLAKMVYRDSDVRRRFDCFAWAYISQQCNTRDVLEGILIQLLSASDVDRTGIEKLKDDELVQKLYHIQSEKKCLVILDDIWDAKAWNSLSPAFPNTDPYSKILITTRKSDVASFFEEQSFDCFLYELKLLTEEKSWELFEKTLSLRRREGTETELSTEMRELGKEMVRKCGRLPLAIEVLGGLLGTKHTLDEWEEVCRDINRYISEGEGHGGGVTDVLALSYQDLPYNLKACFLYLSHLPEDHDIRAAKLVQMWMAESIVSSPLPTRVGEAPREEETMLDAGMSNLGELVQRCMVQVQLTRFSRRAKLCRLHDLMRDLCLLKAQEENFFKVVRLQAFDHQLMWADSASSSSSSPSITTIRRLAVYYLGGRAIDSTRRRGCVNSLRGHKITMNHHPIRSCQFYFFGNYLECSSWRQIKSLFKDCTLLKVLDLEGMKISTEKEIMLPRAIGNLIHLGYLSTRDSCIGELPSSIGNLAFLQTLDLRGYRSTRIPNVLWRLEQLRHLYLPFPWKIKRPCIGKLRLDGLGKLETLEGFATRCFDVRCFPKLTNLRKLGVKCADTKDLAVILQSPTLSNSTRLLRHSSFQIEGNFRREEEQSLLRQLLGCHHLHKLSIDGSLNLVKLADKFPPNLTKLTLDGSNLEEDPMPTLEKLPNLRILILDSHAYTGKEMVCSAPASTPTATSSSYGCDGGFPQLKSLSLWYIPNLEQWRIEEGAMPSLVRLVIAECPELKEIPDGLRFITTLRELNMKYASEALKERIRGVGEDFYKVQHVPSIILLD